MIENPLSNNRTLTGPQAFKLGIADAMFEPADFLEQSVAWAAKVIAGAVVPERANAVDPADPDVAARWAAAVAAGRAFVEAKTSNASPAPAKVLDVMEANRTLTQAESAELECETLADLMQTDEFRATVYAFLDLVQQRSKRPAGAPDRKLARPVTKVGVVGAGLMASQLALLFARQLKVPVVMTDIDQARVDKGVGYVHAEVDKLLAEGPDQPGRRQPHPGAGHRIGVQGGLRRRRLRDRGGLRGAQRQEAGLQGSRGDRLRRSASSPPTPPRCPSPRWPRTWSTRSGWWASTSSTRWP